METDLKKLLDEALALLADHRLMGECSADLLVWYGNRQHEKRKAYARSVGAK